jgi:hypothetical protein
MLQPVYPRLRKYPSATGVTLGARNGLSARSFRPARPKPAVRPGRRAGGTSADASYLFAALVEGYRSSRPMQRYLTSRIRRARRGLPVEPPNAEVFDFEEFLDAVF